MNDDNLQKLEKLKRLYALLLKINGDLAERVKFFRHTTNLSAIALTQETKKKRKWFILASLVTLLGFLSVMMNKEENEKKDNKINHQKRSIEICMGWLKDEKAKCAKKVRNCIPIKDGRALTPKEHKQMLQAACKSMKKTNPTPKKGPKNVLKKYGPKPYQKPWTERRPQHR